MGMAKDMSKWRVVRHEWVVTKGYVEASSGEKITRMCSIKTCKRIVDAHNQAVAYLASLADQVIASRKKSK